MYGKVRAPAPGLRDLPGPAADRRPQPAGAADQPPEATAFPAHGP